MPRRLFDFKCTICDHVEEKFVDSNIHELSCGVCGHVSKRKISPATIALPGWDSGYPTASSKWERQHEKAGGRELK